MKNQSPTISRPLSLSEGHLFVELPEGPFLVDTGSPFSFSTPRSATVGSRRHELPAEFNVGVPVGRAEIARFIKGTFAGLLGMDVLGQYHLAFDLPGASLHFASTSDGLPFEGGPAASRIELRDPFGAPAIITNFGLTIFDTGAQYGYVLDARLCSNDEPAADIVDYNPVLGEIHSPSWQVEVDLTNAHRFASSTALIRERVGVFPALYAAAFSVLQVRALIGCSWLKDWVVALNRVPGEAAMLVESAD